MILAGGRNKHHGRNGDMDGTKGIFRAIDKDMCDTLEEITSRGNDAEVRKRYDGSYDVFELEKKRPTPKKAG